MGAARRGEVPVVGDDRNAYPKDDSTDLQVPLLRVLILERAHWIVIRVQPV
jgi:hypothetical protein